MHTAGRDIVGLWTAAEPEGTAATVADSIDFDKIAQPVRIAAADTGSY